MKSSKAHTGGLSALNDGLDRMYGNRNPIKQGMYYLRHIAAMTKESLHSKADIAAELAHRDMEIDRLLNIAQQAHDRLLRGDSDKELLIILESTWKERPNAELTGRDA